MNCFHQNSILKCRVIKWSHCRQQKHTFFKR